MFHLCKNAFQPIQCICQLIHCNIVCCTIADCKLQIALLISSQAGADCGQRLILWEIAAWLEYYKAITSARGRLGE